MYIFKKQTNTVFLKEHTYATTGKKLGVFQWLALRRQDDASRRMSWNFVVCRKALPRSWGATVGKCNWRLEGLWIGLEHWEFSLFFVEIFFVTS